MKKTLYAYATACLCSLLLMVWVAVPAIGDDMNWDTIKEKAKSQHVFWNAWGGDARFNAFMAWAGEEVEKRYGVQVTHVKLSDTADAVRSVLADKQAQKDSDGAIDLIWINGANFKTMKENDLLYGPFLENLPHYALLSPQKNPAIVTDFTVATEGYEAPWGMAQLVILYDEKRTKSPPRTTKSILAYAEKHKGRITYSAPPDFTGTSLLKQILIEQLEDTSILQDPPKSDKEAREISAPLWAFLDALHPNLWRDGKDFPSNATEMERLLADGFIDISYSFNVNAAWLGINAGDLPSSARTTTFKNGGLSNVNFVAIPYNAKAKEGAMVLANFLLSPEAQGRRQNPQYWGDPSVLDPEKLSEAQQHFFAHDIKNHDAILPLANLHQTVSEPHPDWGTFLQTEWKKRFHTR